MLYNGFVACVCVHTTFLDRRKRRKTQTKDVSLDDDDDDGNAFPSLSTAARFATKKRFAIEIKSQHTREASMMV